MNYVRVAVCNFDVSLLDWRVRGTAGQPSNSTSRARSTVQARPRHTCNDKGDATIAGHGGNELGRRELIRRTALTAGTAVWAVPVIRTIAATPAYAQSQTSPVADHSACVAACNAAADRDGRPECKQGGRCQSLCDKLCPNPTQGGLEGRPCINCEGAADPSTFTFGVDCTATACGHSA